ncbi:hypothetical protein [Streptomyces sp. NPDC023838]|uniref:hypothetical protein n=1 Tax=Streptomyces sp. NPDC023838 TaxID=3154325 RepID=UPI00340D23A2
MEILSVSGAAQNGEVCITVTVIGVNPYFERDAFAEVYGFPGEAVLENALQVTNCCSGFAAKSP